ncbi:FAD-dependent oxidoreductase [Streptomyces sp. NPDC051554]|uniref:FAD-dependent oxidoreductase n=1 Tax=Streptomyces sp. NPDC051554 TaxID=3365656 RepID=UPI0037A91580
MPNARESLTTCAHRPADRTEGAPVRSGHKAIVVGGGPAGCATALALARAGAEVLVLEASSKPTERLAGEWIHPAGVATLRRLGVDLSEVSHAVGRGIVCYPDDGSGPVPLTYRSDTLAWVGEHRLLVAALRAAVQAHPRVELILDARVTAVAKGQVEYVDAATGRPRTAYAPLVVGADGRSSLVRRSLGLSPPSTPLARMAGLLMSDVELPYEGYSHTLLGGPGPVLLYRVSPRLVRVCIDVPAPHARSATIAGYASHHYMPHLPSALRPGFQAALSRGGVRWAANRTTARTSYGRQGQALVGDATGYYHPLTAVGLTLAFADAECLARAVHVEEYGRQRSSRTKATEVTSTVLHMALSDPGPAAREIRRSTYRLLRRSPAERTVALRLIAAEEQRSTRFWRPYLRVLAGAVGQVARELASTRDWSAGRAVRADFGGWLRWLSAVTFQRSLTSAHPAEQRRRSQVAKDAAASCYASATRAESLPRMAGSPAAVSHSASAQIGK